MDVEAGGAAESGPGQAVGSTDSDHAINTGQQSLSLTDCGRTDMAVSSQTYRRRHAERELRPHQHLANMLLTNQPPPHRLYRLHAPANHACTSLLNPHTSAPPLSSPSNVPRAAQSSPPGAELSEHGLAFHLTQERSTPRRQAVFPEGI